MALFTTKEHRVINAAFREGKGDAANVFDGNKVPSVRELMSYNPKRAEFEAEGLSPAAVETAMRSWVDGYREAAAAIVAKSQAEYDDDLDGLSGGGFIGR